MEKKDGARRSRRRRRRHGRRRLDVRRSDLDADFLTADIVCTPLSSTLIPSVAAVAAAAADAAAATPLKREESSRRITTCLSFLDVVLTQFNEVVYSHSRRPGRRTDTRRHKIFHIVSKQ